MGLGTTESTTSEEDQIPPPLPAKQREADYCNLPDQYDRVKSASVPSTPLVWNKSVHPEFERNNDISIGRPPTPPPKTPSS